MDTSILDQVRQQISGPQLQQLASQLGTDPQTTQSAIDAALPLLVGGLAHNTAQPQGAEALLGALTKDHDGGGILANLGGLLSNPALGRGGSILGHVLGPKQGAVEQGLGKATGMSKEKIGSLLIILAPIVLGVIGRMRAKNQMDAPALQKTLVKEKKGIEQKAPQAAGKLGSIFDRDQDGQVIDDIADMVPGLGSLFAPRR
jgi:hypothetical protein